MSPIRFYAQDALLRFALAVMKLAHWIGNRPCRNSNGPVPQTPKMNCDIPAEHRGMRHLEGAANEGWTAEIASAAVTDSVGISGDASGAERLVSDIGAGL